MADAFDSGDVVAQVKFPLAARETATALYEKCLAGSRLLLRRAVPPILQQRAPRSPQDPSRATVCPDVEPRRLVDRTASVDRFDRTVRAFSEPYHGARVPFGGEYAIVREGEPGEGAAGIPIPLADGMYRVLRLSFEGEQAMDWSDFLRLYPDAPELLGKSQPARPSRAAEEEE